MFKFFIFNSEVFVQGEQLKEHKFLSDILAFEVPNWQNQRRWIIKKRPELKDWDGKKRMYDRSKGTFPAGFLSLVLSKLEKAQIQVSLEDCRQPITPLHSEWLDVDRWHNHLGRLGLKPDLRKSTYQVQGAQEALENSAQGISWPRGLLDHATGSGKTALAALLLKVIDRPALLIVERLDLKRQTAQVFEQILGKKIGLISEGKFLPDFYTVSTIQTITKKLDLLAVQKYLRSVEVVILDECQNLTARKDLRDRYMQLLIELQNAYYRFGISGTPLMRRDIGDAYLMGAFGSIISTLKAKTLIEQNLLAKPDIRMIKIKEPKMDDDTPGNIVYDLGIVHNLIRNQTTVNLAITASKNQPTMILVSRLAHVRLLQDLFKEYGVKVSAVTYKVSTEDRGKIIKQFSQGEIPLLLVTSIFDVGIDIQNLRFMIVASGGKSVVKTIQRLGRGLRKKTGGENKITLVDFLDRTHCLLEEASLSRLGAYRSEGYEVKILQHKLTDRGFPTYEFEKRRSSN